MSDEKSFSRRDAQRKASALRRSDAWNPQRVLERRESPLDQLKQEDREKKTASEYEATSTCKACQAQRIALGDETALCDSHFEELMAF